MNHKEIAKDNGNYKFLSIESLEIGKEYAEVLIEDDNWGSNISGICNCLVLQRDSEHLMVYLLDDFPLSDKGREYLKLLSIDQVIEGKYLGYTGGDDDEFDDGGLLVYDRFLFIDDKRAFVNNDYVGLIGFIPKEL